MNKIISGIYIIKNVLNSKVYIGCSTNIYRRWKDHNARYLNSNSKEFFKPLYIDMREYEIENFKFEILEEVFDIEDLYEREQFYIEKFEAYDLGYNIKNEHDKHGKAKLTLEDVIDIRERYDNLERKKNVFYDYCYKINATGFHKVWNGYTWKKIHPEVFSEKNKEYHKNDTGQSGSENGRTALTEKDVYNIRNFKKEGNRIEDIYKKYSNLINFNSFKNVWYGYNWRHVIV